MKIVFILSLLFLIPAVSFAQKVFETKSKNDANLVAYITDRKKEATLIVYKTENIAELQRKSGVWYFTANKAEATWRVYFTTNKAEATVIVFYTKIKSEAGFVID